MDVPLSKVSDSQPFAIQVPVKKVLRLNVPASDFI